MHGNPDVLRIDLGMTLQRILDRVLAVSGSDARCDLELFMTSRRPESLRASSSALFL